MNYFVHRLSAFYTRRPVAVKCAPTVTLAQRSFVPAPRPPSPSPARCSPSPRLTQPSVQSSPAPARCPPSQHEHFRRRPTLAHADAPSQLSRLSPAFCDADPVSRAVSEPVRISPHPPAPRHTRSSPASPVVVRTSLWSPHAGRVASRPPISAPVVALVEPCLWYPPVPILQSACHETLPSHPLTSHPRSLAVDLQYNHRLNYSNHNARNIMHYRMNMPSVRRACDKDGTVHIASHRGSSPGSSRPTRSRARRRSLLPCCCSSSRRSRRCSTPAPLLASAAMDRDVRVSRTTRTKALRQHGDSRHLRAGPYLSVFLGARLALRLEHVYRG